MKQFLVTILVALLVNLTDGQIDTTAKHDSIPLVDSAHIHPDSTLLDSASHSVVVDSAISVFEGKKVKGIASFYSFNLDGTKTSTGETYRNKKMTAASNNFKLNTWVRVTNLNNGKFVIVRINDRMHPRMAKKGRVVDLSRSAAKELDFMKAGLTHVKVEEIENPEQDEQP